MPNIADALQNIKNKQSGVIAPVQNTVSKTVKSIAAQPKQDNRTAWMSNNNNGQPLTAAQMSAGIWQSTENDPAGRTSQYTQFNQALNTAGSSYHDIYRNATSQYIDSLSKYGIDASNADDAWFDNATLNGKHYTAWLDTTAAGAVQKPTKPTKPTKNKPNPNYAAEVKEYNIKMAAWEMNEFHNDYLITKDVEKQMGGLYGDVQYYVGQGLSDDEIRAKVGYDFDKNYNLLAQMRDTKGGANKKGVVTTTKAIGYNEDTVTGMIWAARNGSDSTDWNNNAAHYYLGHGKSYVANVRAEKARDTSFGNKDYNPYYSGSNMEDINRKTGRNSYDTDFLNATRSALDGDPSHGITASEWQRIYGSVERSKALDEEITSFENKVNDRISMLGGNVTREAVERIVEDVYDNGTDWKTIRSVDGGIAGDNRDPVNLAVSTDYHGGYLDYFTNKAMQKVSVNAANAANAGRKRGNILALNEALANKKAEHDKVVSGKKNDFFADINVDDNSVELANKLREAASNGTVNINSVSDINRYLEGNFDMTNVDMGAVYTALLDDSTAATKEEPVPEPTPVEQIAKAAVEKGIDPNNVPAVVDFATKNREAAIENMDESKLRELQAKMDEILHPKEEPQGQEEPSVNLTEQEGIVNNAEQEIQEIESKYENSTSEMSYEDRMRISFLERIAEKSQKLIEETLDEQEKQKKISERDKAVETLDHLMATANANGGNVDKEYYYQLDKVQQLTSEIGDGYQYMMDYTDNDVHDLLSKAFDSNSKLTAEDKAKWAKFSTESDARYLLGSYSYTGGSDYRNGEAVGNYNSTLEHLGKSAAELMTYADNPILTGTQKAEAVYVVYEDLQSAKASGMSLDEWYEANPDAYAEAMSKTKGIVDVYNDARAEYEAQEQQRIEAENTERFINIASSVQTQQDLSEDDLAIYRMLGTNEREGADSHLLWKVSNDESYQRIIGENSKYISEVTGVTRFDDFAYYSADEERIEDLEWNVNRLQGMRDGGTLDPQGREILRQQQAMLTVLRDNDFISRMNDAVHYDAMCAAYMDMTLEEYYDKNPQLVKSPEVCYQLAQQDYNAHYAPDGSVEFGTGVGLAQLLSRSFSAGFDDWVASNIGIGVSFADRAESRVVNDNSFEYIHAFGACAARSEYRSDIENAISAMDDANPNKAKYAQMLADATAADADIFYIPFNFTKEQLNDARVRRQQMAEAEREFIAQNGTEAELASFNIMRTTVSSGLTGAEAAGLGIVFGGGVGAASTYGLQAFAEGQINARENFNAEYGQSILYGLGKGAITSATLGVVKVRQFGRIADSLQIAFAKNVMKGGFQRVAYSFNNLLRNTGSSLAHGYIENFLQQPVDNAASAALGYGMFGDVAKQEFDAAIDPANMFVAGNEAGLSGALSEVVPAFFSNGVKFVGTTIAESAKGAYKGGRAVGNLIRNTQHLFNAFSTADTAEATEAAYADNVAWNDKVAYDEVLAKVNPERTNVDIGDIDAVNEEIQNGIKERTAYDANNPPSNAPVDVGDIDTLNEQIFAGTLDTVDGILGDADSRSSVEEQLAADITAEKVGNGGLATDDINALRVQKDSALSDYEAKQKEEQEAYVAYTRLGNELNGLIPLANTPEGAKAIAEKGKAYSEAKARYDAAQTATAEANEAYQQADKALTDAKKKQFDSIRESSAAEARQEVDMLDAAVKAANDAYEVACDNLTDATNKYSEAKRKLEFVKTDIAAGNATSQSSMDMRGAESTLAEAEANVAAAEQGVKDALAAKNKVVADGLAPFAEKTLNDHQVALDDAASKNRAVAKHVAEANSFYRDLLNEIADVESQLAAERNRAAANALMAGNGDTRNRTNANLSEIARLEAKLKVLRSTKEGFLKSENGQFLQIDNQNRLRPEAIFEVPASSESIIATAEAQDAAEAQRAAEQQNAPVDTNAPVEERTVAEQSDIDAQEQAYLNLEREGMQNEMEYMSEDEADAANREVDKLLGENDVNSPVYEDPSTNSTPTENAVPASENTITNRSSEQTVGNASTPVAETASPAAETAPSAGLQTPSADTPATAGNPEGRTVDDNGKPLTQFARDTAQPSILADPVKEGLIREGGYDVDSNKAQLERAEAKISELGGREAAVASLENASPREIASTDNEAMCVLLMADAVARGDIDTQARVANLYNKVGTFAGQLLQARKIFGMMTPAGKLAAVMRLAQNKAQQYAKRLGGAKITISNEAQAGILNATTDAEMMDAINRAQREIAEQIPATWGDTLNTWRYLSMLGNFKTHVRNVVGNAAFAAFAKTRNTVSGFLQKHFFDAVDAWSGNTDSKRTRTIGVDQAYKDFAKSMVDIDQTVMQNGGKFNSGFTDSVEEMRSKSKIDWIGDLSDKNSEWMSNEDWVFKSHHYRSALANYLQANNIDVSKYSGLSGEALANAIKNDTKLMDARKAAVKEAMVNTFNNLNLATAELNKSQKVAKAVNVVQPFVNVPANIVSRTAEYSPIGLLDAVTRQTFKLKNGEISTAQWFDRVASGLTGTGAAILGTALYELGVFTPSIPENEEGDYLKALGYQEYSLTLPFGNDKWNVTIDSFGPIAAAMAVGAEIARSVQEGGGVFDTALNAIVSAGDPLLNLTMLEGMQDLLGFNQQSYYGEERNFINDLAEFAKNRLYSYGLQYLPTLGGQLARTFNGHTTTGYVTRQGTYIERTPDNPLSSTDQYYLNKYVNKIPFLSNILDAVGLRDDVDYVDRFGEKDSYDKGVWGFLLGATDTAFAPWYMNKIRDDDITKTEQKFIDASKADGEYYGGVYIPKMPTSMKYANGETVRLKAKEMEKASIVYGDDVKAVYAVLAEMPEAFALHSSTYDDVVSAVANEAAKHAYFGGEFDAKKIAEDAVNNAMKKSRSVSYMETGKTLINAIDNYTADNSDDVYTVYSYYLTLNPDEKAEFRSALKPQLKTSYNGTFANPATKEQKEYTNKLCSLFGIDPFTDKK